MQEPTPCFACRSPVVYVEGALTQRRVAVEDTARAFFLTVRQPAYLADGTLVVLEAGTCLTGHAAHDPACPKKRRGE